MPDRVRVRPPLPTDAPALAALAGELGYPTDAEELLGGLAALHATDAAYRFYAREGYEVSKASYFLTKALDWAEARPGLYFRAPMRSGELRADP